MTVTITSRPQPDGKIFTHSVTGFADRQPAPYFTDALRDVERLAGGDTSGIPMVNAWEDNTGWAIEVTLWSTNASPTMDEIAALEGTLAEVIASTEIN